MMTFNGSLLDATLAPGISSFTAAEIPDLSAEFPQSRHWMSNHFLNSIFGPRYAGPLRVHLITALLRAQLAFAAYQEARSLSSEYFDGHNPFSPRVRRYFELVGKWETCVHNIQMFIDAFNKFAAPTKAYDPGDNSEEERVCKLSNDIKHLGRARTDEHTVPMWLTNTGLQSFGSRVSYQEMATLVRALSGFADRLQHPGSLNETDKE